MIRNTIPACRVVLTTTPGADRSGLGQESRPAMKKILLVCAAWLAVVPSQATAGLDLSWSACNRGAPPGTGDFGVRLLESREPTRSCSPTSRFRTGMSGFFALDAVIDLQTSGGALPPFWHFETGAVTPPDLRVRRQAGRSRPSADNANSVGSGRLASDAFITAYGAGLGREPRATAGDRGARRASSAVRAGWRSVNYYGFHLDLAPTRAGRARGAEPRPASAGPRRPSTAPIPLEPNIGRRRGRVLSNSVTLNGGKAHDDHHVDLAEPGIRRRHREHRRSTGGGSSLATAALATSGETNIPGSGGHGGPDGQSMTATFDLSRSSRGLRNVVATNPPARRW